MSLIKASAACCQAVKISTFPWKLAETVLHFELIRYGYLLSSLLSYSWEEKTVKQLPYLLTQWLTQLQLRGEDCWTVIVSTYSVTYSVTAERRRLLNSYRIVPTSSVTYSVTAERRRLLNSYRIYFLSDLLSHSWDEKTVEQLPYLLTQWLTQLQLRGEDSWTVTVSTQQVLLGRILLSWTRNVDGKKSWTIKVVVLTCHWSKPARPAAKLSK